MDTRRAATVLIVASFVAVAAVLLRGRPVDAETAPGIVRARALELVDENGRVRAQLNVERINEVVFRMRDTNGTIRVKLGASEEGSGLVLLDASTEPGVAALAKAGDTSLTMKRGTSEKVLRP